MLVNEAGWKDPPLRVGNIEPGKAGGNGCRREGSESRRERSSDEADGERESVTKPSFLLEEFVGRAARAQKSG